MHLGWQYMYGTLKIRTAVWKIFSCRDEIFSSRDEFPFLKDIVQCFVCSQSHHCTFTGIRTMTGETAALEYTYSSNYTQNWMANVLGEPPNKIKDCLCWVPFYFFRYVARSNIKHFYILSEIFCYGTTCRKWIRTL